MMDPAFPSHEQAIGDPPSDPAPLMEEEDDAEIVDEEDDEPNDFEDDMDESGDDGIED